MLLVQKVKLVSSVNEVLMALTVMPVLLVFEVKMVA
jgi:hypothetical protein